jgi:hypothetical protein
MRNVMRTGVLALMLAAGLAGCNDATSSSPTAPSAQQAVPPPAVPPPGFGYAGGYTLKGVALFGIVSEMTPTGPGPIADVSVYCDACGEFGHTWLRTDGSGYYSFSADLDSGGGIWLSTGPTVLLVAKEGYQDPVGLPPGERRVMITADTQFDIQLVRR